MKRNQVIIQVAVLFGIITVINLIANKAYFRLDFTADKRYTLSDATRDVIDEVEDVVTIKAYFSEDLPPQLKLIRQDFEEQLIEYENLSQGNIVFEFIDPGVSEIKENEAQQEGITPVTVQVTEKDQVKQQRAYMGAILEMGDKKEVIPMIQMGAGMEYSLTTSLKKLAISNKPKIGLLQGHGEPSLQSLVQLHQQLSILYDVESFRMSDTTEVPAYMKTLVIIDPKDTIPQSHLARLDRFMAGGGSLFMAYSNMGGDLNSGMLNTNPDIGLSGWLHGKGIQLGNQFVVDATCLPIGVQQGPFVMQVQFPYFPVASSFAEHPVVQGLESVVLPVVSTVRYNGDSLAQATELVFTSENSGLQPAPAYIDINYRWTENDFTAGSQPVALAVKGSLGDPGGNAKMVVISNGSFISNGEGQQQQQVHPDNINFASNAIDWLSDETGLVELRTKAVTSRPLEAVEDGTRNFLKYGNLLIPIFLVMVYGFIRRLQYTRKQQRWLQGSY